ncbi:beta-glucosidase [Leptodontidium sp. MPI-SDFR-AT-0119]|nr:beta-glucosidase [Leptodontidium sp. MPI-SDFR-AT-0119]
MWETCNVDRLGIQSLKTTDGPAATFDPKLVDRIERVLGAETKSKRSHVLLAPTMNLSRSPFGGRNFENFGEDPFLTGTMATSYIKGVQSQGVDAFMEHYLANDMETRRFNMDEQIDEQILRELYLQPFQIAPKADPWTAMTAYPKINGEHADTSKFLVTDILREDWGFNGIIMNDWGGLNETVKSIRAGINLEMPSPPISCGLALLEAVRSGAVSEKDDVDPAVKYLLRTLARSGLLRIHEAEEPMGKEEFRATARQVATSGIVLLKNNSGLVPLEPTTIPRLAIIGLNANSPTTGGTGNAIVNPYYVTTPYDSICEAANHYIRT